jgi:hypothetical protein
LKQELGFSAAIAVVVAAAIGLTSQINTGSPSAQGAHSSDRASEHFSAVNQSAASDFSRGACGEIESLIQNSLAVSNRDLIAPPASCFVSPEDAGTHKTASSKDVKGADPTTAG